MQKFSFTYLHLSVSGYPLEVSPIKALSKDKKRKYFNFAIQNDKILHRGLFVFPQRNTDYLVTLLKIVLIPVLRLI